MPIRLDFSALNLTSPVLGDAPIGSPVRVDLGQWAPGTDLTADLLQNGVVVQTGLNGDDIVFTPADDEAVFVLRVTGVLAGEVPQIVASTPVTARYAPPQTVPAQVPQVPEIYDENTGPQALDLGPAFAGDNLHFTTAGLTVTTINSVTGILTTSTDAPIASGEVTVTAQNSGGSAAVAVDIIVEDDGDMILTPTTMQTSVTDPLTNHTYSFVAADGVKPEAREVGQYQDGTWFVLGEPGDEVRIGSITPVSTSVSTAAYTRPDNCDDTANTGAQTRWMNGTMVNPWQGRAPKKPAPMGFDSYYGSGQRATNAPYQHDQNVDPGKTGAPLVLAEGSIVKSESFASEGAHSSFANHKTRMLRMSCLTVVPEIPAQNSFRPPIRGTDKRSYWTTDQLDISGNRQIIQGFRPYTKAEIDAATAKIKFIQQTFAPYQEQARRWNPGARGGGIDIYGDDWYQEFGPVFACFHGDYTDTEIEDLVKATVQVGIDIYGLLSDNSYYFPWQAHHAGRKGICLMAGRLLNNPLILGQCTFSLHPEHFGVDDAYCGYVQQNMIGVQPRFYKGTYPYQWEQEHLGLAEWAAVFTDGDTSNVATEEQVADPDIARRDYQVLSFDREAMYQLLWGMIMDPNAAYYNPAYFDFADRFLAIRFGDQIDGVWDASSNESGTNFHFRGNWVSINPNNAMVANFQTMRNASSRANHVLALIPEALPKPQVSHTGSNAYLDVDFNANNFQMPQNKDVAITGYDLRWTAYAGGADTIDSEEDAAFIGDFAWNVVEDVTLPFQLSGAPRGLTVKVQIRMKNMNGPGPWMDERKRENYGGSETFAIFAVARRYSTNFDVPDIAEFNQIPINFKRPSVSAAAVVTGMIATGGEGIWSENPAVTSIEYQWQMSDDGSTGWSDISGATAITFATTATQEGKSIRLGVRKANRIGASPYAYGASSLAVVQAAAVELGAGKPGSSAFDPGAGVLGGRRLLIMYATRKTGATPVGGNIGAYSFGASELIYEDNTGSPEASLFYQVVVPSGETAETISFTHSDGQTVVAVYELAAEMRVTDTDTNNTSGLTLTVDTISGGVACWLARTSGWVNFVSSTSLIEHSGNPNQDTATKWAAAHALGVVDGSVNITHSSQFASNTRTTLISLEPVS